MPESCLSYRWTLDLRSLLGLRPPVSHLYHLRVAMDHHQLSAVFNEAAVPDVTYVAPREERQLRG